MTVMLGRVSLAAVLVLGGSGVTMAREAGSPARGAKVHAGGLHGIGFNEPRFRSGMHMGKDQPYTWPVGDRYHPVSKPFYGRSY
ncbi:hypothetical protein [Methylobacterium sp. NEAU K]|uniref:hypothetical protein n=1 Tax=Methylobacterium sp. NEAU K TaxID=3064946 RepID=UPI0027359FB5|nr:hypothetical protein [Methylobacterium sp. NEAU K]MDP4003738.1 hypothetical protein [Methylobacterium sp. NEAU K]